LSSYFDRLRAAVRAKNSLLCVGLDPEPARIPGGAAQAAAFCIEVIARTAEFTVCYKPNAAFWEQYGPDGWQALAEVRASIPSEIPVLFDSKRGDVGNTMAAYARGAFESMGMDAATVQPYMGSDSIAEYAKYPDRGIYVLCRTSNPGAADLQHLDLGGRPLYERVVDLAEGLNQHANLGLVVGATAPAEIEAVRAMSALPLLIPGVGAQGGDLEESVRAAWNGDEASCLIAVSRAVLYAPDPGIAARTYRDQMRPLVFP
jgi:orotidine 5'-phosphate decarboxylase subfamily 2